MINEKETNEQTTSQVPTQQTTAPLALPQGNKEEIKPEDDDMHLKYFTKDAIYDCMSVPSDSSHEFRMVAYIMRYCEKNGIKYEFDSYGNIYLTKGEVKEGEYYPCVTAHMDTVQHKQYPYAKVAVSLPLKTERVTYGTHAGKHKVSVDGMGIGADDKGGVCIGLQMFQHQDVLKAVFFLEEEIGMKGSQNMDKNWFNDVGYVIGYDSPDLNRAAWKSSATKLFDGAFYKTFLKPVCDKWGLTDFRAEPFTDVSIIGKETDIVCMNFGNGGYEAHSLSEYIIIEDMEHALGMGSAIIDSLGKVRHTLQHKTEDQKDNAYLATLSSYYRPPYNQSSSASSNSVSGTKVTSKEDLNKVKYATLEYVGARYESHIESMHDSIMEILKKALASDETLLKDVTDKIEDVFGEEITF